MTTTDPITNHVTALARTLRGPQRTRRCMLAEVHTGLLDAAEAHQNAGLPPEQAATRAVRDFGEVREIAPPLQAELTARQGRWSAALFALVFPTMLLTWDLLWSSGLVRRDPDEVSSAVRTLAALQDKATLAVAATAVALLATTYLRSVPPRLVTRAIGATGTAGALLCGGMSVVMCIAGGDSTTTLLTTNTTAIAAYAGSGCVLIVILWHAIRTLRLTRH